MTKAFEKEIRDLAKRIAAGYGLKPNDAELFVTLYLEPKEISLEELSIYTGYSLSTISTKMKFLENMSIVQRIRKPGSKKAYYFMKKDIIELNIDKINQAYNVQIIPIMDRLPIILERYRKKVMGGKDEGQKIRFRIMEDYLCMVKKLDKLLKKMMREMHKMQNEISHKA